MTREEKEAMKDKAIHDAMCSIENRVRHVYNQGYSDGLADGNINSGLFADKVREAYNNGLEDAWECARKILFDSSLPRDILTELGADSFSGAIHKCSASEVIAKLKEYEEQKKQSEKSCKDCKHGVNGMLNFKSGRCEACYYDERIGGNCLFEEKQTEEKTDKSNLCANCETCRFADLTAYEFPCSVCSASHTFRWEARKGASE